MLRRGGSSLALLLVPLAVLAGCSDKAKPDYDKCVAAETAGDVQGVQAACEDAIKADPDSKSGKEAAQKLVTSLTKERDRIKADLASTNTKLSAATASLSDSQGKLQAATSEITKLKETAQYHYEQALKLAEPDTDDADQAATTELQGVLDRYPNDLLIPTVKGKMKEYEGRIKRRAADLRVAQAQVRNLIATCRSSTATAKGVRDNAIHFDMFQQVDMNTLMAGSQQAAGYEKQAKDAKEKATELLKTVPDPGGKLAEAVERCDGSD